jgi:hypothetical protein
LKRHSFCCWAFDCRDAIYHTSFAIPFIQLMTVLLMPIANSVEAKAGQQAEQ